MILKSLFTKVECARFLLGFKFMMLAQTIQRTWMYNSWSLQIQRHSALAKVLEEQELVIAPARLRDFYKTYILNISNNLWVCLGFTWYSGIMFFYIVQNRLGESNPCSKYFCKFVKAFWHKIDKKLFKGRNVQVWCDIVSK